MKETKGSFEKYVQFACYYAFLEYDLGIEGKGAVVFYLDEYILEMLGFCWVSSVSIPDAANLIAIRSRRLND